MTTELLTSAVLASHIHMAWCGSDVVVLDVESDEYALLVDAGEILRPGPAPGVISVSVDHRSDLELLGLISTHVIDSDRTAIPPLNGEIADAGAMPAASSLVIAALNSLQSTLEFKRKPFRLLIGSAARRPRASSTTLDVVAKAAKAFRQVHPWIPFEGDCLQRGYMLHLHLRRAGAPARWVFGVRTWPFLAHCWVQIDDQVIGDSLERVRGFTPIMAV